MTIREELWEQIPTNAAGWYAAEQPTAALYGPPLRLAPDAGRYDISPAWLCWVGAVGALELIEAVGVERIGAHDIALANRLRAELGLEPGDSPIVSLPDPGGALERVHRGRRPRLRPRRPHPPGLPSVQRRAPILERALAVLQHARLRPALRRLTRSRRMRP